VKVSPMAHDAIVSALSWRNILVHPTLLMRTAALRAVSGYRSQYGLLEDYDLYARLAMNGARFHVIPKVLVHVRSSNEQSSRRGGVSYWLNEVSFRYTLRKRGFLSLGAFLITIFIYSGFRLMPNWGRRKLYSIVRS
jgi:hypothetical protein